MEILSQIAVLDKYIVSKKEYQVSLGTRNGSRKFTTGPPRRLHTVNAGLASGMVMYIEHGDSTAILHFSDGYDTSCFRGDQRT